MGSSCSTNNNTHEINAVTVAPSAPPAEKDCKAEAAEVEVEVEVEPSTPAPSAPPAWTPDDYIIDFISKLRNLLAEIRSLSAHAKHIPFKGNEQIYRQIAGVENYYKNNPYLLASEQLHIKGFSDYYRHEAERYLTWSQCQKLCINSNPKLFSWLIIQCIFEIPLKNLDTLSGGLNKISYQQYLQIHEIITEASFPNFWNNVANTVFYHIDLDSLKIYEMPKLYYSEHISPQIQTKIIQTFKTKVETCMAHLMNFDQLIVTVNEFDVDKVFKQTFYDVYQKLAPASYYLPLETCCELNINGNLKYDHIFKCFEFCLSVRDFVVKMRRLKHLKSLVKVMIVKKVHNFELFKLVYSDLTIAQLQNYRFAIWETTSFEQHLKMVEFAYEKGIQTDLYNVFNHGCLLEDCESIKVYSRIIKSAQDYAKPFFPSLSLPLAKMLQKLKLTWELWRMPETNMKILIENSEYFMSVNKRFQFKRLTDSVFELPCNNLKKPQLKIVDKVISDRIRTVWENKSKDNLFTKTYVDKYNNGEDPFSYIDTLSLTDNINLLSDSDPLYEEYYLYKTPNGNAMIKFLRDKCRYQLRLYVEDQLVTFYEVISKRYRQEPRKFSYHSLQTVKNLGFCIRIVAVAKVYHDGSGQFDIDQEIEIVLNLSKQPIKKGHSLELSS